jgi:hypothetical protein
VEFSRHTISLHDQKDIHQVLQTLSSQQDLIVVNIADSAVGRPMLLSQENLDAILNGAPESLFVETMPLRDFKRRMREDIAQSIESTVGLRARLRSEYVHDLEPQVREFLSRLEQILLMINCYVMQNSKSGVGENSKNLQSALGRLSVSSFEHGDNVRCMDDLQYQILPSLRLLQKIFRK